MEIVQGHKKKKTNAKRTHTSVDYFLKDCRRHYARRELYSIRLWSDSAPAANMDGVEASITALR